MASRRHLTQVQRTIPSAANTVNGHNQEQVDLPLLDDPGDKLTQERTGYVVARGRRTDNLGAATDPAGQDGRAEHVVVAPAAAAV